MNFMPTGNELKIFLIFCHSLTSNHKLLMVAVYQQLPLLQGHQPLLQQQHCLASAFAAQSRKRSWRIVSYTFNFNISMYIHIIQLEVERAPQPMALPWAGSAMYQALIPSTHVLQLAAVLKHRSLSNAVQSSPFNHHLVTTLNMTLTAIQAFLKRTCCMPALEL